MAVSKQWFEVEVWLPGRGPLRTVAKGETWEEAKAYAESRYPRSIAFPAENAAKPELVRSKNGPKKTAQEKRRLTQQESRS